jgi:hypothetical protein
VVVDLPEPDLAVRRVTLVVGPHEHAAVLGPLVLLRVDHPRDRRAGAVGPDDERRAQLTFGGRDAGDAPTLHHQPGHRGLRAHLGARLGGGVHEDLVERDPANAQGRRAGQRDDVVDHGHVAVEGDPAAQHRGCELQQRVEDPDPLEDLHARGLDRVGRQRVAREAVLVDQADPQARTGQHRGQRRTRAARTDHDDVERLAHPPRSSLNRGDAGGSVAA